MKQYIRSDLLFDVLEKPITEQVKLASDKNTNPNVLLALADSNNLGVLMDLVQNPKVPSGVLYSLAEEQPQLLSRIAGNPNIPQDLLRELASSSDAYVRYVIATNKSTPIDILQQLADDPDANVRLGVCENPKTPKSLVTEVATTIDAESDLTSCFNCTDLYAFDYDGFLKRIKDTVETAGYSVISMDLLDDDGGIYNDVPYMYDSPKQKLMLMLRCSWVGSEKALRSLGNTILKTIRSFGYKAWEWEWYNEAL